MVREEALTTPGNNEFTINPELTVSECCKSARRVRRESIMSAPQTQTKIQNAAIALWLQPPAPSLQPKRIRTAFAISLRSDVLREHTLTEQPVAATLDPLVVRGRVVQTESMPTCRVHDELGGNFV